MNQGNPYDWIAKIHNEKLPDFKKTLSDWKGSYLALKHYYLTQLILRKSNVESVNDYLRLTQASEGSPHIDDDLAVARAQQTLLEFEGAIQALLPTRFVQQDALINVMSGPPPVAPTQPHSRNHGILEDETARISPVPSEGSSSRSNSSDDERLIHFARRRRTVSDVPTPKRVSGKRPRTQSACSQIANALKRESRRKSNQKTQGVEKGDKISPAAEAHPRPKLGAGSRALKKTGQRAIAKSSAPSSDYQSRVSHNEQPTSVGVSASPCQERSSSCAEDPIPCNVTPQRTEAQTSFSPAAVKFLGGFKGSTASSSTTEGDESVNAAQSHPATPTNTPKTVSPSYFDSPEVVIGSPLVADDHMVASGAAINDEWRVAPESAEAVERRNEVPAAEPHMPSGTRRCCPYRLDAPISRQQETVATGGDEWVKSIENLFER